jgi:hypothetical protein
MPILRLAESRLSDHRRCNRKVALEQRSGPRMARRSIACCAENNLEKAQDIFTKAIKHRPRIRLTIRRRTRVLQQWPP